MASGMFYETLQHASPGFALGQRLAELHADKYVLECDHLSLSSFEHDGHCKTRTREQLYSQFDTHWSPDHGVYQWPACAWLEVEWEAQTYEVVQLEWPEGMREKQRSFIIAPTRERAEALFAAVSKWNHEVRGEILVFSNGCFHKSKELYQAVKAASFEQLVLEGSFKDQIRDDFTQFLASKDTYAQHGVPWRRGALFIGPPGNGKTLCVKALINTLGIPCLYIQSFDAKYSPPQQSIEAVFERARKQAPCIMVLEDIDALLVEGTRSFFLNELDGFASNAGVITLATTNHPERLDPSIVERPSRFDRKYHFELPSTATRARYVTLWNDRLQPQLRVPAAGCDQIVELTEGFSFAYVQEVFVSATMQWMSKRDPAGILPTALEQITLLREQMRRSAASQRRGTTDSR